MAITVNGTANTIAGLAVGGLPDGTVDTDMLATNAITSSLMPAGAILQVAQAVKSDATSTNSTGPTEVSSDLRASFSSLQSTSSKVLVTFNLYISQGDSSQSFRFMRSVGGAAYGIIANAAGGDDDGTFTHWAGDGGAFLDVMSFSFLDSPSTTSSVSYTPYWRVSGNTCYLNRGYSTAEAYKGISTTTIMEIAG